MREKFFFIKKNQLKIRYNLLIINFLWIFLKYLKVILNLYIGDLINIYKNIRLGINSKSIISSIKYNFHILII